MNLFSHCVLTASDEPQAAAFRSLLDRRIRHGLYPREISSHVYPDPLRALYTNGLLPIVLRV